MLTYEQSNAISQLRVLAMLSIVSCHILQGFGNRWAWILNVGVQVFFVISGYLYGTKEISNWKMWFVKRVEKIYIPFILFVFVMLTLYACFSDISIKSSFIIKYLLNIQGLMGGGKWTWTFVVYNCNFSLLPYCPYFAAAKEVE